jgi:MOSC domain-containing protein YiiM
MSYPQSAPSVISVNVGLPREVVWHGESILTSIFKTPVAGRIAVRHDNLRGDQQADLTVHGGPAKAIYVYPADYYAAWHEELPGMELPWGMFGENLTVSGLDDSTVRIGDRYSVGSVEVIVTQPRLPCYKLGLKFGRDSFLKQFLESGRTGFYLAILQQGGVGAGDAFVRTAREPEAVTVADVVRLYTRDRYDVEGLRRAVRTQALPDGWRSEFQKRLERALAMPPHVDERA